MEAVKMPSASQVKSQIRTVSADASKGGDEFKKLLQVKNEQVQKEQPQPNEMDVKKKDSENSGEQVEDAAEGKKDHIQDTDEEILVPGSSEEQDALLQAAMQQTMAQMAGIVTQPEQTEEPVEITVDSEALLTEEPLLQNISLQAEPEQNINASNAAVQNVSAETVSQKEPEQPETVLIQPKEDTIKPEQPKESKGPADREAAQDSEYSFKGFEGFQGAGVSESQPSVTEAEQKVQTQERTNTQENLYGAAPVKSGGEQAEHIFTDQRTETVPMKTSQDTLPQDLGRTLAARLPGGACYGTRACKSWQAYD